MWSLDEKVQLVDSVVKQLPIPLRHRLNDRGPAVQHSKLLMDFSALRRSFPSWKISSHTKANTLTLILLATRKARKDAKEIRRRKKPSHVSGIKSRRIANYQIPVSIDRRKHQGLISDDVFRRINSGGQRLSLHEIRRAGVLGPLAHLVRKTSASIRGDGTFSDSILLNEMDQLSISRRDLDYGIKREEIFWVRHNIVSQDDIRSSGDEEMVLDLILDTVLDPLPTTGWTES